MLTDADNLLTAAGLGKKLGFSSQTIRNWRDRGLKIAVPASRNPRGVDLYDLEEAERWLATYRSAGNNGGKRPNAGRPRGLSKRRDPEQRTLEDVGAEREAERRAEEQRRLADEAQRRSARAELHRRIMAGELTGDELVRQAFDAGVTRADVELITALNQAARSQFELDVRKGKFVEVEETRKVWVSFLSVLGRVLEAVPGRIQRAVAATLALDEAAGRKVLAVAAEVVAKARGEIEQPERPAEAA